MAGESGRWDVKIAGTERGGRKACRKVGRGDFLLSSLATMVRIGLTVAALCVLLCLVQARPTIYKINDNDKLEPVLIPVSSTVIPLPVYKVSFSLVASGEKDKKVTKPVEPIKLITASKKKVSTKITDETDIK